MTTPVTPVDGIKTELAGVGDDLLTLGLFGVGISAVLLVLNKGYGAVKGMIKPKG